MKKDKAPGSKFVVNVLEQIDPRYGDLQFISCIGDGLCGF